ncbi:hypothetical protein OL239_10725 [Arthrobacter sp. ATA002]|uniref:hypothetical protein n=1 Tax=Arthrobacter sp. ATA002 TaxID=2991715 RepID=UPI0022A6DE4D|nr:hypothetical protein [Arthrobacter sp. ATA002]WAP50522.1 hypothetical protein OL239_10725 [Arthrobacter sp. ATA002]
MPAPQRTDADSIRREFGFLTVTEVLQLCATQRILDPSSTLISAKVQLGEGNVFYPGIVLQVDGESSCVIGHRNVFHPGAFISAEHGGMILMGSDITLGPGSVQLRAGRADAVAVGDSARLSNGPVVTGRSVLGSGSQILGAVEADSVVLVDGGDFASSPPEKRGAVLKGAGLVSGVRLAPGYLLQGFGDFSAAGVVRQTD